MSHPIRRALLVFSILVCLIAACSPSDPVLDARKLMEAGDYDASVEALQALLEEMPDDPEVNYLYGVTVASQGQPILATWSFRKAMDHPDWLARAGIQFAHGALTTMQHDAALEALDRVIEAEPENIEALLLRARTNYESRRGYEESLADADRVLELDPDSRDAVVWRAVTLMHLDRIEEAEAIVNELEQRYAEADAPLKQTLFFCAGRASFAAAKGEVELADERFRECLALDPTHRAVIEEAVGFYTEQDDKDRVLEIYEAAYAVDPVRGPFRSVLAGQYFERGRAEEGEALLLEGTESEVVSDAVNSWMDLAELYSQRDDYAASASAVKGAVDRMTKAGRRVEPLLLFNYADMLLLAERYDEARAAIQPSTVPHFKTYIEGRVLLEEGDAAGALEKFNATLKNWPNNAASRYYSAVASEELADFNGAIEAYRYAIRAGPGSTDARIRLGRLHAAAGNFGRANTALAAGTGKSAVETELRLEGLRVIGLSASGEEMRRRLRAFRGESLAIPALVAMADGLHERSGAEDALVLLLGGEPDLTRPAHGAILRAAVEYLVELDRHDDAITHTAAAVAAFPDFAPFHEAHGRALLGAGRREAKAAFERADELAPENGRILEGLGQVAARGGDIEEALALFARASVAAHEWSQPDRSAAELLLANDRNAEAEDRLAEVLDREPYDAWAPAKLAELMLARGADGPRTQALVSRAAYFAGGDETKAVIEPAEG